MRTKGFKLLLIIWVMAAQACTEVVHVRLSHRDDPDERSECNQVISHMRSFWAEMLREDEEGGGFYKCINIDNTDALSTLDDLQVLVAERVIFEEVPQEKSWTIWVEGFIDIKCPRKSETPPLFCGREERQLIPPPENEIMINISCVAPAKLWPDQTPKKFWFSPDYDACRFK
jgi:hypothetical protein